MQTALRPVRLKETSGITELTVGVFQTVGVPTDEDTFLVTDPANLAFYFYPADGDIASLRNVVMFRVLCFHMPFCKIQTCYSSNNDNDGLFRIYNYMYLYLF